MIINNLTSFHLFLCEGINLNKMDGFFYNNIFETKGIEYLIIITFLVLIIPFWLKINKKASKKDKSGRP